MYLLNLYFITVKILEKIMEFYMDISNWTEVEAWGTWASVIVNLVLTIFIIRITWVINKKQIKLQEDISYKEFKAKDLELKISLFNKRHNVYVCFLKYFEPFKDFPNTSDIIKTPIGNIPRDEMLSKLILGNTKTTRLNEQEILKLNMQLNNINDQNEIKKIKEQIVAIRNQNFFENLDFLKEEEIIIGLSEFCYPKEINEPIINYVKYLHKYIIPSTPDDKKKNFSNAIFYYKKINEDKILDKMKILLKLAYDDIQK
jgi:hypothetical protein